MPTKREHVGELTPAMVWVFMVGDFPGASAGHTQARLHGWFDALEQLGLEIDRDQLAAAYRDYVPGIVAEARAAGFAAWITTGITPRGSAFDSWRAKFIGQHSY